MGQKVKLLYDPKNPSDSAPEASSWQDGYSYVMICMASCLVVMSAIWTFLVQKNDTVATVAGVSGIAQAIR